MAVAVAVAVVVAVASGSEKLNSNIRLVWLFQDLQLKKKGAITRAFISMGTVGLLTSQTTVVCHIRLFTTLTAKIEVQRYLGIGGSQTNFNVVLFVTVVTIVIFILIVKFTS